MAANSNHPDQAMVNKALEYKDIIVWQAPVDFTPADGPFDMEASIPNVMERLRTMTTAEATELGRTIESIQFWLDELPSIGGEEEEEGGRAEEEDQILRWERMKEIDLMTVPATAELYAWDTGVNVQVVMAFYLAAKCWLKDNNCIFPEDWPGEDPRWRVPHRND